jgi:two-component system sensor histidine kinase BaeS
MTSQGSAVRRSLLLRLVVLSSAVGSAAVVATVLLAVHATGDQPGSSASPLEIDNEIRAAMLAYGNEHPSWDGVDAVVRDLAERTGRRIALTTPDGGPIADSARLLGDDVDLPAVPAATIDSAVPRPSTTVSRPATATRARTEETQVGERSWQLTAQERRERRALGEAAVGCLRATGVEASFHTGTGSQVLVSAVPLADEPVSRLRTHPCVPAQLFAPSAAARELNARTVEQTADCLDQRGLAYAVIASGHGLHDVVPEGPSPPAGWTECADIAGADAKRPYVAPPAELYIGASDRFDPFSSAVWWRTVATAGGVLTVAAVVTVLVGRRLVRPIRALTEAAVRIENGDRRARVPVRGDDELARLAGAFNALAASIERGEQQHRAIIDDVTHELRSPLANVRSHLEAAEDGVLPLDAALVRSLQEECELLARLVGDLQELATAEAGNLAIHVEERDAADLAAQAVAAHRARAEAAGVTLRRHAPQPVPVSADPARLRQALDNLLANAITHTPAGGNVEVTVQVSGPSVLLAVSDDGPGIGAQHLPHVFERSYRADPSCSRAVGGGGLGLAIAKYLVEAHGGQIGVSSTPGAGSVFTIRLPRSER